MGGEGGRGEGRIAHSTRDPFSIGVKISGIMIVSMKFIIVIELDEK